MSLRNDAAWGSSHAPCVQLVMTTGDQWCGLLPTTPRLPSLGQPQGEAANLTLRVGGAALQRPHLLRSRLSGSRRLDKEYQRWSHGSFSRASYRTGLSLFRNRALLRATSTILQIRTAVRRFLKARRNLRGGGNICATKALLPEKYFFGGLERAQSAHEMQDRPFLRFRCRLSISGEQTRLLRGNTEQAPRTRSWQSRKTAKKLDNGARSLPQRRKR